MCTEEFDNIIYIEDSSTYYKRKTFKLIRYMILISFGYTLAKAPQLFENFLYILKNYLLLVFTNGTC